MPEEIAFARRQAVVRRTPLRPNGAFFVAVAISMLLFVPPVLVGWRVGEVGGLTGIAMAVVAGGVVSVLVTLLAARAWLLLSPGDRLFADATLTGWVRRARAERQIKIAREVFDDPNVASIPLHVDRLIAIAGAIEARDARTHRHSGRVAVHAAGIGKHLGLNAEEITRLKAAAKLHDVGALRVPSWAEPTPEESLAVALAGSELVEFTGDRRLVAALKHQHEHFDGSGLPDGLSGDAIPLTARIIAVADAYDTAAREHGQTQAIAGLHEDAGSKFDPDVVEAFVADAQASPVSALRGAVAGMIPRASQGAAELLRGSASVAAAASIATTAVVATGVGTPSPSRDTESAASVNTPAAVATTTAGSAGSSNSKDSADARSRSDLKGDDAKSPDTKTKGNDGSVKTHDGQPNSPAASGQSSRSDSPSSSTPSETRNSPSAGAPVQELVDTVDQTVQNTTGTVDQVVTDVTDTADQTTQQLTGTVDNVVGGLTGKKK
ncbi:MAG: HD domain-containing protein [Thermoleophilaceae bacterium]|nr:HD domain-containing protein [Thermoleophilaceae bacterium]